MNSKVFWTNRYINVAKSEWCTFTIMSINLKLLTTVPNENLLTFYRKQPGCKAKQQLVNLQKLRPVGIPKH